MRKNQSCRAPMQRRPADIDVSDHAVLRWLERIHGLSVDTIRSHLAGQALTAAELGAISSIAGSVKLHLQQNEATDEGTPLVAIATVTRGGSSRRVYRRRR
ncbi:hypothetical protein [Roseibium sp.]|uniref:hypothetical protein n=1 Tax=Roseibium sp. TaxID=1936156 RepID=UPI0032640BE3